MLHLSARYRPAVMFAALFGAIGLFALVVAWTRGEAATPSVAQPGAPARSGLTAFGSERELRSFLQRLRDEQDRVRRRMAARVGSANAVPPPPPTPAPMAQAAPADGMVAGAPESENITNNQEQGVDEGGIVKNYRDMLVMLRRGRLFTVSLAGGEMRPIASINAFPPGVTGAGDWYDEMLVSGDRVIVIGYSYARGGTEINRFRITPEGQLSFEDAYHLRSNDYYSSRNYASRLIGTRLVYYTPLYLNLGQGDLLASLPGVRRWDGNRNSPFRPIADARQIYIAPGVRNGPVQQINTLHSIVSCDLAADELDCGATGVLGPSSRTFYVSGQAVYLWVAQPVVDGKTTGPNATLYRVPLDPAQRPAAVAARGMPVDQFSFREDAQAGRVDVLLRSQGRGDAMWAPERTDGAVALLQVPFDTLGDGRTEAPRSAYRTLIRPGGYSWNFQNRFVGNYVLYGSPGSGGDANAIYLADVRGGPGMRLPLSHGVERIEAMGADALVVGAAPNQLGFTSVELTGGSPRIGDRYSRAEAAQGESRSHGFFYSPDRGSADGASGTLGLPIAKPVGSEYRRFFGSAAAMLYLRRDDRRFSEAGELDAQLTGTVDDGCTASCVDWYGNARPIFWRGRVFALLGYELVEGRMDRGRISEIGRINYAPRRAVEPERR